MDRVITSTLFRRLIAISIVAISSTAAAQQPIRDFDTMGDVNCEDEHARLDNVAVQLNQVPGAKVVIIFYGGRLFRGRLPRRNESEARAARLRSYLVQRRGIPRDRIVMINGGYKADWEVAFWIVPPGAEMPVPQALYRVEDIKFRKGRVHPREFRCQI